MQTSLMLPISDSDMVCLQLGTLPAMVNIEIGVVRLKGRKADFMSDDQLLTPMFPKSVQLP